MKMFWLTMLGMLMGTVFFNWLFTLSVVTDSALEFLAVLLELA